MRVLSLLSTLAVAVSVYAQSATVVIGNFQMLTTMVSVFLIVDLVLTVSFSPRTSTT